MSLLPNPRNLLLWKNEKVKKQLIWIYFIILIPQIGRQIFYFISFNLTGSANFIDSAETFWMANHGLLPWLGIIEELLIGLLYINLILIDKKFWFLIYGWIFDAWQDMINAVTWVLWRFDYVHYLAQTFFWREFIENLLVPYLIVGPLLYVVVHYVKNAAKSQST